MLIEVDRPDASDPMVLVGNPVKLSAAAEGPLERFPMLGEHTREVLAHELELASEEIEALAARGVLRLGGPKSEGG